MAVTIGLKNLVYAVMQTTDDGSSLPSYGSIVSVPGVQTAKLTRHVDQQMISADDAIGETTYLNTCLPRLSLHGSDIR
jgi:hypothetical protein